MVTESMAQLSSPKEKLDGWNAPEDRSGHNSLPRGNLQRLTCHFGQGVLPISASSQLLHLPPSLAPRCGRVSLLGGHVVTWCTSLSSNYPRVAAYVRVSQSTAALQTASQ